MNLQGNTAVEVEELSWLASLPTGWTTKALSRVFEMIGSGHTPPSDNPAYYDGNCLWVTTGELREVGISETSKKITSDALNAFPALRIYPVGTLLIAMYGATIGRLGWLEAPAAVNQACCALARPASADARYVFYCFIAGQEALLLLSSGGGQPNVSQEKLRAFRIPQPPLPEQAYIASFLDREIGKIDALVAEQERLIALLKEKRQTVISQAVTKGMNPNVKMKDSDAEWLGEVPAHWSVRKLKSISRLETGHTPSRQHPEYWVEEECVIPWFTLADVGYLRDDRNIEIECTEQKISALGMENSAARLLPPDSVILSRTASVGFSGITTIALAVSQDFAVWICGGKLLSRYLLLCLRAMRTEFRRLMMGSTHQTIYMPDIEAFRIPLPGLDEQTDIVMAVAASVGAIDSLVEDSESAMALLRERRAALISAAVTGKIDVRNQAATAQAAA